MDGGQTKVLVLGGGLSGLTAASSLADSGKFDVTVVEGGKLLGGHRLFGDDGAVALKDFDLFAGQHAGGP